MDFFILRHGIAADRESGDFDRDADRPLTPEGIKKVKRIAGSMKAMDLDCQLILSSPYLRAKQTAEIVTKSLGWQRRLEFTDELTPGGEYRGLIGLLNRRELLKSVLLVGHEPHLSGLISLLTTGETSMGLILKKGGLAKLSTDSLLPGKCAALEWLLTPKQMGLMD